MESKRIMIIGASGNGKTTLANKLGPLTGLPVVHLDQIRWLKDYTTVSKEAFDEMLLEAVNKDEWIIDGNYNRTIPLRLKHCDTIIYLDYSRVTALLGVIKRTLKHYGKSRPDMGPDCKEHFDFKFMKWIWLFNKNYRKKYYGMIEAYPDKKVIILKNRKASKAYLSSIISKTI